MNHPKKLTALEQIESSVIQASPIPQSGNIYILKLFFNVKMLIVTACILLILNTMY